MTIETSIEIERVEPHVFRVPIETPVVTSFGVMRDRPAVFIRVSDRSGAEGWGEVWCIPWMRCMAKTRPRTQRY